ncbi:MAG: SulP family inorganic anion transporter [Hyphomicrobiales bacterium]|nr:SulP family inorganic anion transporter [Hyphomicrobiales bacterium]
MAASARIAALAPSFLPFLGWLRMCDRASIKADLVAGLTGAIVVLPQGVAFATISGMPPQYGLYAAIVPTIIAALFGSSWHLVAGPSTTASLVLFTSLTAFAEPGSDRWVELALTLALMVGVIELGLGLFKLGAVVNFISNSVVVGYTTGVGILIIAHQIQGFFGIPIPRQAEFLEILRDAPLGIGEIVWPTTLVAMVTLLTAIAVRTWTPKIPYMIVAIVAGGLAAAAIDRWHPGLVTTVGALPAHLPPLSMPDLDPATWRMLLPTAFAVAVSASNEVVSISRALALRCGQHVDANQEFIGQGLANGIGSFFSAYVVSGSFNRSALNYDAGAKTPLSAVSAGVMVAGILVFAAPLAAYLPHAAMAASLVLVGWSLIDRKRIVQILRSSNSERAVMAITIFTALFVQIQAAILSGVVLSLIVYLYRSSKPEIVPRVPDPLSGGRKFTGVRPDLPECRQLRIIRVDGSLFFGAVAAFQDRLRRYEAESPARKHLGIVMTGVNFVDLAGAEALVQAARRWRARGGGLYLIRVKERVWELLDKGGHLDEIGRRNVFTSKTDALRTLYRKFDYDECRTCGLHVFVECARMGKQEPLEEDFEEEVTLEKLPPEWVTAAEPTKPGG